MAYIVRTDDISITRSKRVNETITLSRTKTRVYAKVQVRGSHRLLAMTDMAYIRSPIKEIYYLENVSIKNVYMYIHKEHALLLCYCRRKL